MPGASTYTKENVINAILRGVALPLPATVYVSLHTADPGVDGSNEVTLAAWPGYLRRDAANGVGGVASGWSAADSSGNSKNAKQVTFPSNNGAGPITITHFALWDANVAGNMIVSGILTVARTLAIGDILVFDVNALSATLT
jgi:hypothetical protein